MVVLLVKKNLLQTIKDKTSAENQWLGGKKLGGPELEADTPRFESGK